MSAQRLLFLDCETTGFDPPEARLLEVGMVVVELPTFEIVDKASVVIHYTLTKSRTREGYYDWHGYPIFIHENCVKMHTDNGLWADCAASGLTSYQKMDELVQMFVVENGCQDSALGGANPGFDRKFLRAYLPGTDNLLHYRNFDTNTLWLLQSYILGQEPQREKGSSHRAVDDCLEAITQVEKHFDFMTQLVKAGAIQ